MHARDDDSGSRGVIGVSGGFRESPGRPVVDVRGEGTKSVACGAPSQIASHLAFA